MNLGQSDDPEKKIQEEEDKIPLGDGGGGPVAGQIGGNGRTGQLQASLPSGGGGFPGSAEASQAKVPQVGEECRVEEATGERRLALVKATRTEKRELDICSQLLR